MLKKGVIPSYDQGRKYPLLIYWQAETGERSCAGGFYFQVPEPFSSWDVNIPGSLKNSAMVKEIFTEGINLLAHTFRDKLIDSCITREWKTGPEGFLTLDMEGS